MRDGTMPLVACICMGLGGLMMDRWLTLVLHPEQSMACMGCNWQKLQRALVCIRSRRVILCSTAQGRYCHECCHNFLRFIHIWGPLLLPSLALKGNQERCAADSLRLTRLTPVHHMAAGGFSSSWC